MSKGCSLEQSPTRGMNDTSETDSSKHFEPHMSANHKALPADNNNSLSKKNNANNTDHNHNDFNHNNNNSPSSNHHRRLDNKLDCNLRRSVEIPDVKVSSIIGDFGPYQITVVIFSALRAMCCAMDGLSGPFVSPNIKSFSCQECKIDSWSPDGRLLQRTTVPAVNGICKFDSLNENYLIDPSQCFYSNYNQNQNQFILQSDRRILCSSWSFNDTDNERFMNSLTIEQSLVCDREWLKSLSNSMYYVGATIGLLFWGIISDRYGRKTAYVCSHIVCLIFGLSALFAESMTTFIILRSINAFGMIGELIPRSIQVEMVATDYRFICSLICQIGWAIGIILVPALSYLNPGYRFILSVPVLVTVLMLPWLIWLPESARWLIINKKYPKARAELRRAARINGKLTDDIDSKIEQYNRQVMREEIGGADNGDNENNANQIERKKRKKIGVYRSILAIFTNLRLFKDTMSVFVLLFVAEVVYFSLTLNVADLGGSLYLNYLISGLSELVSVALCAILLSQFSRRVCLSLLLLASTVSYLLMALTNVYEEYFNMPTILLINAFGKLTAIGNLMVIILVSQEVFPTVIRQFGTSLCITVGKSGSAVAPFTHELGQMIGQAYCFGMFSLICLSCAIIPFGLSETGNRELPDLVIDVEENKSKRSLRKKSGIVGNSNGTPEQKELTNNQWQLGNGKLTANSSEKEPIFSGSDSQLDPRQLMILNHSTAATTDL